MVAGFPQHFRDGDAPVVEVALVRPRRLGAVGLADHAPHAGLMRIQPGQQRGAGRAAAGGVVESGETDSPGGQPVEVGRVDLSPIAAQVGKAHVVGHDQQDVRPVGGPLAYGPLPGTHASRNGQRRGPQTHDSYKLTTGVIELAHVPCILN
ncbi:hypothetical protein ES703_55635 [subsurface metagenome]